MKRIPPTLAVLLSGLCAGSLAAETPATNQPGGVSHPKAGHGIERAMTLLADSTPSHRSTLRLLFYGQSGVESPWWPIVVDNLKQRFPSVNFIIENRALGGFASQFLVNTSEADLYPFQPDLMIFNVAGADNTYEDIIRRTTERTVSDILIMNDYVQKDAALSEETEPAKIIRGGPQWGEYMNFVFLPSLEQKYGTGLVPIRQLWKQHLSNQKMPATDLLGPDKGHLNMDGCKLMADFVNAYLVTPAAGSLDPYQCDRVKTLRLKEDLDWKNGKLNLPFKGNRVDVVFHAADESSATIMVDGKKPSEHMELYRYTRALTDLGGKFPVIFKIGRDALPLVEEWTLEAKRDPAKEGQYTFAVRGSLTGPDGEGRTDERFVSHSKRIIIEPGDWCYQVVFGMLHIHIGDHTANAAAGPAKILPETFVARWHVEPLFVNEIKAPKEVEPGCERVVTAVQGLRNESHELEITGDESCRIEAIRFYRPRLSASE